MRNSRPTPAYYAIIPAPVRYDVDLPLAAKILYGELTACSNISCSNIYGYCTVDNKYLSEVCEISNRRVEQCLNLLETKGYIAIDTTENHRHLYLLVA